MTFRGTLRGDSRHMRWGHTPTMGRISRYSVKSTTVFSSAGINLLKVRLVTRYHQPPFVITHFLYVTFISTLYVNVAAQRQIFSKYSRKSTVAYRTTKNITPFECSQVLIEKINPAPSHTHRPLNDDRHRSLKHSLAQKISAHLPT